ncbi:MAG: spondin domain-containing protein [Gammaproteobacteria bacterium]|nr:spondin domain-containing protein [Gammaproteobacteria bacterium]
MTNRILTGLAAAVAAVTLPFSAHAASINLKVTVENLVAADGVAFAPLRVAFHGGTHDSFDVGSAASGAIEAIAELGDGTGWFAGFAMNDPGATWGTIPPLPLVPGGTGSAMFTVDTDANPYFSFAAMVVPSNDFFIGNDNATGYQLFNGMGALMVSAIELVASDIWEAGTELFDPATAAFIAGANATLGADQNGLITSNYADLALFNGQTTAAGYTFNSQLTGATPIYRIAFEVVPSPVPVPAALPLLATGLGWLGISASRKKKATA